VPRFQWQIELLDGSVDVVETGKSDPDRARIAFGVQDELGDVHTYSWLSVRRVTSKQIQEAPGGAHTS
jgi:hypothetical protein